jgi:hypothetical protein
MRMMREKVSAWIGEQRRRVRAMRDAGQFDLSGIFKVSGAFTGSGVLL